MEIKSLHTHVDIVSRSKGASVIAKAAYNGRDKLRDEYYVKVHDYSKKDDLIFSKIFLPEHIPNPDKPEKLFLFSTPCVILKKKGVFICYSLINTLIKFMASLHVMTA